MYNIKDHYPLTSWRRDIAAAVVEWSEFEKPTTLLGEFTAPLFRCYVMGDVIRVEEAGIELQQVSRLHDGCGHQRPRKSVIAARLQGKLNP